MATYSSIRLSCPECGHRHRSGETVYDWGGRRMCQPCGMAYIEWYLKFHNITGRKAEQIRQEVFNVGVR